MQCGLINNFFHAWNHHFNAFESKPFFRTEKKIVKSKQENTKYLISKEYWMCVYKYNYKIKKFRENKIAVYLYFLAKKFSNPAERDIRAKSSLFSSEDNVMAPGLSKRSRIQLTSSKLKICMNSAPMDPQYTFSNLEMISLKGR